MTCRGYDNRAVKISKTVKRKAARIIDNHRRGEFIRGYVRVAETELRGAKRTKE